jgi:CRISPR-associated endonuclease/helicase Cas3
LTLAHGSTFLNENYMQSIVREVEADKDGGRSACSSWLADNRKKALLAPCGAGTMDQAILGILGAKHQSLRLLGLCRSVLVADEVHSYDTYTGTLLANLLTFHAAMGGSAVLLSATMTGWLRRKLVRAWHTGRALAGASPVEAQGEARDDEETFPLMTRVCDSGCERRPVETTRRLDVAVRPVHDPAAMPDALEEAASAGACACWIRNTVSDVLEAARVLVEERGIAEEDVLIFHSRFTGADRAAIEGEVLRRFGKRSRAGDRSGKILIASQVVEQSLDLDFDLLLSDLAPMELMIQRAGRCHRHERSRPAGYEEPAMHVLMPRPEDEVSEEWFADLFEKGQYVYPHVSILWRTARLLQEKQAIVLPRDARTLVEGACGEDAPEAPEALGRREDKAVAEAMAAEAVARFGMLDFAKGYAFEDTPWGTDVTAPTRLGEDSVNVRLLRVAARSLDSATVPESCERSVSELLESMPDKGKWSLCLPLQEASHGVWVGNGKDGRGRTVSVRYDRRTGLVVES